MLPMAKPISDDGDTCEIELFRRGRGERERCEGNSPVDPRVSEGGEGVVPGGAPTPWKAPMLKQLMKNCSLWGGSTLDKFVKDCMSWEEPHAGAAKESKDEGIAETT